MLEGSSESRSDETAISLAAQLFLTHVLFAENGLLIPTPQPAFQVCLLCCLFSMSYAEGY